MSSITHDVAIIGGGPAGNTAGTLLKKYDPKLKVVLLEREKFPREHIGESQLPVIGDVLEEMGCWEKVEAANFPIKIGVTFRWGRQVEPWNFEFLKVEDYIEEPRPRKFVGQARRLAFQVDRAIYDQILLKHSAECGVEVREAAPVAEVLRKGDRVEGLRLANGEMIVARHYIDSSGNVAILRRAMGVETTVPTKLMNIAIWDYWENTEWGELFGNSATRVLVMSLGYGWIWFIPVGKYRTSIGLVCPQEYFKECGKTAEQLYAEALASEPVIGVLTAKATRENVVRVTKDWSFLSTRMAGENWFLAGEAAGFADPILSAGMSLSHTGAREAAYTILELDRGEHDPAWLRTNYEETQRLRIGQHIRFADFWYSANGIFTDLKKYTAEIAKDAGLNLDPVRAFHWLATGGFTNDFLGQVGIGGLDVAGAMYAAGRMIGAEPEWQLSKFNSFALNLKKAREEWVTDHEDGRIRRVKCWVREGRRLPYVGLFKTWIDALERFSDLASLEAFVRGVYAKVAAPELIDSVMSHAWQALETMLEDKWVRGRLDPKGKRISIDLPHENAMINTNVALKAKVEAAIR